MATEEKETKLENDSPSESESTSCLKTDEALAKLEDHRCAICQNILINACRIGCGHTFCRHCLNVDRENRHNGSKSTCFICDAAVTEITRNEDKDKEIDALYASLPTNERLSRERTKFDRKLDEENFQKKPKETNNDSLQQHFNTTQSSNPSGDGAASLSTYTLLRSTNEWYNADENRNINVQVPTFYGGTFRVQWQRDNDNEYDLPNLGESISGRQTYDEHESNDDLDEDDLFNRPSPPLVVHHTIQHVYHTVQVGNSSEQNDIPEAVARDHSARNEPGRGSSEWRDSDHNHDHNCQYTPPPCTCPNNNGSFRYQRYPYMNSPSSAQSIPRVYAYPQYGCGYPYSPPSCYHPSLGVNTHYVPLTYQNQRTSYPAPITVTANSTNLRFCPMGAYRHPVNVLHPYAVATGSNESSSDRPNCLRFEDERNHENDSEDNETDNVQLTTTDRDRYVCEFHRPFQYPRRSHESLPPTPDFRDRNRRFDFDTPMSALVSNNSDDNENEAHPLLEPSRIEFSESLQEHSDHEDHVITLSFSVPRPERQETEARHSSPLGFSRFEEISRGLRRRF